ncbi:MAG TPA: molybdenum cofactor guanylyltransferase [Pseudonocardia sp.]|jgi:molybdopterin-guanine dinucleotide biosynthesis protein A|nr:molybdenum cofactor guanylyltransferase [Pseudonocardia sp.]
MRAAGVVLVGGRSSRMGSPKAALEWHGSTLLRRATGLLARTVDGPVIVVSAPGQQLPELAPEVVLVADPEPGQGPVVGLATGLGAAASAGAELAFVTATDLPFLHPAYVHRVLAALTTDQPAPDVALPHLGGYPQPLAAGYRTALAPVLAGMAAAGQLRLRALFERCRVRELDEATLLADAELAAADPALRSVRNVNSPDDYAEAVARPAPTVTVWLGERSVLVTAATLAGAATEAGVRLAELRAPAVLHRTASAAEVLGLDGELPLVAGDVLRLY